MHAKYVKPPGTIIEAEGTTKEYGLAGFNGCLGSMDAFRYFSLVFLQDTACINYARIAKHTTTFVCRRTLCTIHFAAFSALHMRNKA